MDLEKLFMDGRFDNSIVFGKDRKEYFSAIIGYTDDYRIIYDYELMANDLADRYVKEGVSEEDAFPDALDWLDYNTLGAIPCYAPYPIIVSEDDMYEGIYHDMNDYKCLYTYRDGESESVTKFTKTF